MVKQPHRLEIAEYVALVGSITGSVAAAISGNIIYAAAPLSVSLLLNLLNRRHLERLMRQNTNAAITRVQRQLSGEIQALQAEQTPPAFSPTSLLSAAEIQKLVVSLIEVNINPVYQELVDLQTQQDRLQNSIPSAIDCLNVAALSAKVDHFEDVLAQLSENLVEISHQIEVSAQHQLDELEQQLQAIQRLEATVNQTLTPKVEDLEQAFAQLSQSMGNLSERVEGSMQRQLDELKRQLEAVQHPDKRRNWKLENKVKYLEQALVRLSEAIATTTNQIKASVQSQLDEVKYQLQSSQPSQNPEIANSALSLRSSIPLQTTSTTLAFPTPEPLLQPWNCLHAIAAHADWVSAILISSDGQTLFSGSFDRTMKLWNLQTGELIRVLGEQVGGVYTLAISGDGKTLASGSADQRIKLWNLDADQLVCTLWEYSGSVRSIAYSPPREGRRREVLASGNFDQTIKIWDVETRGLVDTLKGHLGAVYAIAFSPNGELLASGGADGLIKVWDWEKGELLQTFGGSLGSISAIALSPDGRILASGSSDKTIQLWHIDTGDRLNTLVGHVGAVTSLVMSPDGELLISGSADATIRVWQVETGQLLSILSDDTPSSVLSVAISPDGQAIASGNTDGTIKIWQRDET